MVKSGIEPGTISGVSDDFTIGSNGGMKNLIILLLLIIIIIIIIIIILS